MRLDKVYIDGFKNLKQLEVDFDESKLTTVLIGNSSTYVRDGRMITPRGYADKYDVEVGSATARQGETAGRSLSTGLSGWLSALHAAHAEGRTAAELARQYRLPEDYVAAVLSEPWSPDLATDSDAEDTE